ncbi:MAG: SusC/RagA family TonB-linked outer membrane protein [Ferruginibacter sp.]|nr:SusC/RagA family TonB-linked outer membrane protein [Cytophagales bacterium]
MDRHRRGLSKWVAAITLTLCFGIPGFAQNRVSGTVTSGGDNSALPGVSVLVKGTTTGTTTDATGKYAIAVPDAGTLVFTFIGFAAQEVAVGNRTTVDVALFEDKVQLNEIVVTALGIQKDKAKVGYATQEVKGADLVKAREPNVLNTLVGKVAGLTVAPSAELLGPPNLLLRGNSPLFVVDGVPINSDTWNISADDIDTYTVLKGPSASALYGYRGQFGVIMITTKRGSKDKRGFAVEVNSSTQLDNGFIAIPKLQDLYGPGDHGQYAFGDGKGAGTNDADYDVWGPKFEGQLLPQYDSPVVDGVRQGTPWVARGKDNLSRFIQTGILSTNNIAVSSSTDKYDLRVSVSNSSQRGIVPNTKLNITNFNLSAGFNFSPKLRFESNINFNRQYTPNYPDVQYGPNSMIYNIAIWAGADWNVDDMRNYWQPGREGIQQIYAEYTRYNNPYFITYEWLRSHYKTDVYGYMSLKYKFTDHLDLMVRTQATTYDLFRSEKFPQSATVYGREEGRGDYREDKRTLFETNTDALLTFNKDVSPDFNVRASVGGAYRDFSYSSSYVSTNYLNVPASSLNPSGFNFGNSRDPVRATNFTAPMKVIGGYALFDVSFRNFLTLSATGRLDAISTLPKENNPYFYPSVSLSAVLSDVIKLPEPISFLKLRGSFANVKGGLTQKNIGATPAGSYPLDYGSQYESSYEGPSYGNSLVYNTPLLYNNQVGGYFTNTIANPGLKPFSRTNYEGGVDVRFLQNRLGLDLNYFVYDDGPQIFSAPISETSGYNRQLINGVKTRKNGWEVTVSGNPVRTDGGFNWDVLVNWSTYKEVFTELPASVNGLLNGFYRVGDRIDGYYAQSFARTPDGQIINDGSGRPLRYPRSQLVGNYNPDWVWGVNNRFSYKGFAFSFQFDGRVGGVMVNYIKRQTFRGGRHIATTEGDMGVARENDTRGIKSYVGPGVTVANGAAIQYDSQTGLITNYAELQFNPNATPTFLQDYISRYYSTDEGNLISKSYTKLREVTLGYNVPAKFLGKSFIRGASLTLVGRNLLYFAKEKDVDIDQYADSNYSSLQTPTTRRYGVNVNFTF